MNIRLLINEIKANPYITISELREKINVTERTVARYMKELRDVGIVIREGADKGGKWKVLQ